MNILYFVLSLVDRHFGCFHFLVIMNNSAINNHVQAFVLIHVFNSFDYMPRSKIAG